MLAAVTHSQHLLVDIIGVIWFVGSLHFQWMLVYIRLNFDGEKSTSFHFAGG
ncbi:MAG: hypothetical protein QS721_00610 [Candidatus Endonucleobacter sp. (ex Gigantidas childressi)]|nr:hypothetical protein [Candidatus Endonucleobacter sp. (ex Gigantidas childressi)]